MLKTAFYYFSYLVQLLIFAVLPWTMANAKQVFQSSDYTFEAHTVIDDLAHPWAVEWLEGADASQSTLLITERNGGVAVYQKTNQRYALLARLNIPAQVFQQGQGGLLDIKKHPNYRQNGWIYLTYSAQSDDGATTVLARFKLHQQKITNWQVLFIAKPWGDTSRHFGSRIAFDNEDYIYITVGDRGERDLAQSLQHHNGSVIRLHSDGRLPEDNPFPQIPAMYSYGHRNPQGIWFDKKNNRLWTHEHGPRGGDELNVVKKGKNYGWPVISYGNEYWSNLPVSDKTYQSGMEQPAHFWVPSIAPSGLLRYEGDEFAKWNGDFFLGSLKFGQLVRVRVARKTGHTFAFKVIQEERLLDGKLGRIRAVYQHHKDLFILTDSSDGKLMYLRRR